MWPYAALTLLAIAAALPLLHSGMPCTDDGAFHLHRAVELGSLIQNGHLFPRWAPHMALGYGYPFFNYYAPLSSYVVVALHIAGLAYPTALTTAFVGALWLAGVAVFWLGRALWGQSAGLAAGAVYVFAPYLAYDILFRGNLAESFAFVWPPLVLLGLYRWLGGNDGEIAGATRSYGERRRVWPWLVASVAGYAALILTHNIFALLASPLFAGFVAVLALRQRSWRAAARGAAALALGITLSAYFWLPALAERGLVHSDRLLVPPIFTWYTNFITPADLLAGPRAEDPQLINPSPRRTIGLLPALLSVPALFRLARRRKDRVQPDSLIVGLFALAGLGYALMTLPLSAPVWEAIKPLELVQFPWRMLGPAALCGALLAGAGLQTIENWIQSQRAGRVRRLTALPLLAVLIVVYFANLPWWQARYCPPPGPATVGGLVAYERDSATLGTTAKGEYLPRTTGGVPASLELADALIAGQEPVRLALPEGAGVIVAADAADPLNTTFEIKLDRATTVVYRQFIFPGWRVSVDGQPVEAHSLGTEAGDIADWPQGDTGLIAFAVAAGTHTISVNFGSTPLRNAAAAISLATVAGLTGWAVLAARKNFTQTSVGSSVSTSAPPIALVLLVCAALPALRFFVLDRFEHPLRRSAFDSAQLPWAGPLGDNALVVDFAGGIRLHGYDLSTTCLPSGGALDVALYVSRWSSSERRFWPAFRIEDAAGQTWHQAEQLPPRWHREPPPSSLWPLDQYAQWARHVSLLPGTPPGTYTLTVEIFDLDTLAIDSSLDAAGNNSLPRLVLGTLQVSRPDEPAALEPRLMLEAGFGPLTLIGAEMSHTAADAGATILVSLYWRGEAATENDAVVSIELRVTDANAPAATFQLPPVTGFGTHLWQPGDEWLGQHSLRLPAALPSGDYDVRLSLPGEADTASLGQLHVSAPQRTFVPPPMAVTVGAEWEGVGLLAGYTLTQTTTDLFLDLVWQATATPDESYAVFVHLQGADGRVWRQSDLVPANWSRPTTGWLADEYVLDPHRLDLSGDLPPGGYEIWVGLYSPRTGLRVPVTAPGAAPEQRVLLARITVP